MITRDGLELIGQDLAKRLATARLRVGNGDNLVEAPLAVPPVYVGVMEGIEVEDPGENEAPETVTLVRISLTAEYGPNEANGEWTRTQIVLDGKIIDDTPQDLGRKAQGSAWTLETYFDLAV